MEPRSPATTARRRKRLDLKLTLTFSISGWDVANLVLEARHEAKDRVSRGGANRPDSVRGQRPTTLPFPAIRTRVRKGGQASEHHAEQVLLQPEGADARRTGPTQTTGRQTDLGAKGHCRDRERIRVPVQSAGRHHCGIGGL